jgi:hypothetical protein
MVEKIKPQITSLFFALSLFFVPKISLAATGNSLPGQDLSIQDVFGIINGIACWLLRTVGAVMVIFLVIAGLRFMAAQGNPAKLTEAKKSLNYALLGILVIMGVYVIIATVANAVGSDFSLIPLVC